MGTHSVAPHASSEAGLAFTADALAGSVLSSPSPLRPTASLAGRPRPLGVPWHARPPSRARVFAAARNPLDLDSGAGAAVLFLLASLAGLAQNSSGGRASLRALRCGSSTDWPPPIALANEPCARSAQLFSARRTCLLAPLKGWLAPPSVAGVHAEVPRVVFVAAADDCVLLA